MAHGLELRAPFLDVDFASFCIALPARLKITRQQEKYILRQACSHLWPASIQRRGKKGFGAPVARWLQYESVACLVHEYLRKPGRKIYEFLAYHECQAIVDQNNAQTWTLLVLALWLEQHQAAKIV
jgi:asparagine synthase (glutamine-hydrolysing)